MINEQPDFQAGEVLLIDKPYKWTSFDVVNKLRYGLKIKKIGHAGTLDPLATGLLILCTGKKTKQIDQFQAQEKEYTGTLILGQTRPSIDKETAVDNEIDIGHLTQEAIKEAVVNFRGNIKQIPPQHSAVKINGKRAYKHARVGEEVKIEERDVVVSTFDLTRISPPEVDFRIVCSKGTYIRSLVRDLGDALGVGAYLAELRRTRIGNFKVEDAQMPIEFLESLKKIRENEDI